MALAYPDLKDVAGYYVPSSGKSFAMWIWANTGADGYARFEFYIPGTATVISRASECFAPKVGLNYLHTVEITHTPQLNSFDMKSFRCASEGEQFCPGSVCTNVVQTGFIGSAGIRTYDPAVPAAPAGLSIIPKDKGLTVSWNPVTNADIFAYNVKITQAGSPVADGYLTADQTSIVINDLLNGVSYNVEINAVSSSRIYGASARGSGIPGTVAAPVGSINFVSSPAGADIILDGQPQNMKTPAVITKVPAGTHTFTLKLSGHADYTGSVLIEENKTAQVSAFLSPVKAEGIGAGTIMGISLMGLGILGAVAYIAKKGGS